MINDIDLWRGELTHVPLTKRGWVLQEEVLAARTIYFGARQVLWGCNTGRACETYPYLRLSHKLGSPHSDLSFNRKEEFLYDDELGFIISAISRAQTSTTNANLDSLPQKALFDVWPRFVAHFSIRALTFPADKLLAIAGITRLLSRVLNDQFIAGLWKSHLMEGLLWYVRASTITRRPVDYRAPSWSWASCEGYIMHAEPFTSPWTVARSLKTICKTVAGEEYGMVTSGLMTLQAFCLSMRVDETGNWTAFHDEHKVPWLLVRLDTDENITKLVHIYGAVIRTTAFRLTDSSDLLHRPNKIPGSKTKGKILLAAQGIVLTPRSIPFETSTNLLTANPCLIHTELQQQQHQQFRRIGYFSLEDRTSGRLTPRWVPPGCKIFHEPMQRPREVSSDQQHQTIPDLDFSAQADLMRVMDII